MSCAQPKRRGRPPGKTKTPSATKSQVATPQPTEVTPNAEESNANPTSRPRRNAVPTKRQLEATQQLTEITVKKQRTKALEAGTAILEEERISGRIQRPGL